jgi:hypothetical protein
MGVDGISVMPRIKVLAKDLVCCEDNIVLYQFRNIWVSRWTVVRYCFDFLLLDVPVNIKG